MAQLPCIGFCKLIINLLLGTVPRTLAMGYIDWCHSEKLSAPHMSSQNLPIKVQNLAGFFES